MTDPYWSDQSDPYQYPNSPVLKNLEGILDAELLENFEKRATNLRSDEAKASIANKPFDLATWRMAHRVLFQDVYAWAGEIRSVQLSKGDTVFAMPERIEAEAGKIFASLNHDNLPGLERDLFVSRIAYYFGELNVLHPFREGNGRTEKLLFDEIARRCGYVIKWHCMSADELLDSLIAAYQKQNYTSLEKLFSIGLADFNQ